MAVRSGTERLQAAVVGHIPIEDSRMYYHFEAHGGKIAAVVTSASHKVSPIPKRGLEIPIKVTFWHTSTVIMERLAKYYKDKDTSVKTQGVDRIGHDSDEMVEGDSSDDENMFSEDITTSDIHLTSSSTALKTTVPTTVLTTVPASVPTTVLTTVLTTIQSSASTICRSSSLPSAATATSGSACVPSPVACSVSNSGNNEVLVVSTYSPTTMNFFPIDGVWQGSNASLFPGGSILQRHPSLSPKAIGYSVKPICHPVSGDGNCFFRAISVCVFGHEMGHECVRKAICNYMCAHPTEFVRVTGTVDYIKKERMDQPGTWGTHIEIEAVATMVNTTVNVYTDTDTPPSSEVHTDTGTPPSSEAAWIAHKPLRLSPPQSPPAIREIYLSNRGRHYEPVFHMNA